MIAGTRDPTVVSTGLRITLYSLLGIGAVASLPRIGEYSPFPMANLLDVWFIAFILATVWRGPLPEFRVTLLLLVYGMTRLIPALYTESPVGDFVQAYKWLLYLIAFTLAVGREWGSMRGLRLLLWVLVTLSLLKTAVSVALVGPTVRSGLLIENNFEIALFVGLAVVVFDTLTRPKKWLAFSMLAALTITSGSRSGIIAFAIFAIYAVVRARIGPVLRYLAILAIPILGWVVAAVFSARDAIAADTGRSNFLDAFISETRNWSWFDWAFGTTPLTALSNDSCMRLSYYQYLFSTTGDGDTCYSVILHAFTMRIVFDAGIFGLILALGVCLWSMRQARVRRLLVFTLLAVAVTNGLSVSGLNNPYVALPILLAILTAKPRERLNPTAKSLASAAVSDLPVGDFHTPRRRHARPL